MGIIFIIIGRRAAGMSSRATSSSENLTLPVVVVAVAFCLASAGCQSTDGPGADIGFNVVASFYPLADAAAAVAEPAGEVTNLTPPGVEPHDLELAADDVALIQSADVVFYLGGDFQPALEDALHGAEGVPVDLLQGLPTVEGAPEDGGTSTGTDPHVWLDPSLLGRIVDRIESTLSGLRPSAATTFQANADSYRGSLATLDDEFRSGLRTCRSRIIVTSHAAFGYLARAYGLTQVAITGLSPEAEPDAARLAEVADLVRREGVSTIFTEELVSPDVAETLARETGAQTEVLNPLEGLTSQGLAAGDDYFSVMRTNLRKLRTALGCS